MSPITRTHVTDDDGSGTTGTIANDAWLQALFDTLDDAIAAPWTIPAFIATDFAGAAGMTWTVDAGDMQTCSYRIQGKTVQFMIEINTSSIGGTVGPTLTIGNHAWGGGTIKKSFATKMAYIANVTESTGIIQGSAGGTQLIINKNDFSAFVASTNGSAFYGECFFEIV